MLLAFLIYLADVLENINFLSRLFIGLSCFAITVLSICAVVGHTDGTYNGGEFLRRYAKYPFVILIISIVAYCIVPRSEAIYLMVSSYISIEAEKYPDIPEKLRKVNEIIDYKLEEMINDLKSGSEKVSCKN